MYEYKAWDYGCVSLDAWKPRLKVIVYAWYGCEILYAMIKYAFS